MPEIPFEPHDVSWTPEKVKRFWSWWSGTVRDDEYFARQVGPQVIARARAHHAIGERVLDFGSGPGHLVEHLIAAGIRVEAVDLSREAIEKLRVRFAGSALFGGAHVSEGIPTALAADRYDTIFCLETVEHLLPADLGPVLGELRRLLRPGGHLVVTTPNEEDLGRGQYMCPDCGGRFHRMQHLRSLSSASLAALLGEAGLRVVAIETPTFRVGQRLPAVRELVRRVRGRKGANLLAIARKA